MSLPWSTNEAAESEVRRTADRERSLRIAYPFPCENGMASLWLPKYLTAADVERLTKALPTLIVERDA